MKILTNNISLLFVLIFIFSCSNKIDKIKDIHFYDTIQIDTKLQERLYPFNYSFEKDTIQKKVEFCNLILSEIQDSNNYYFPQNFEKCTSFLMNDTLRIDIGYYDGFSAKGIEVIIARNKFTSRIFKFSDNIIVGEIEPKFSINYQKLILSKTTFNVGDTILGRIFFRANDSQYKKYYASGYFSTIITKKKKDFL